MWEILPRAKWTLKVWDRILIICRLLRNSFNEIKHDRWRKPVSQNWTRWVRVVRIRLFQNLTWQQPEVKWVSLLMHAIYRTFLLSLPRIDTHSLVRFYIQLCWTRSSPSQLSRSFPDHSSPGGGGWSPVYKQICLRVSVSVFHQKWRKKTSLCLRVRRNSF